MGSPIPKKYQDLIKKIWTDRRNKGEELSAQRVLIQARLKCSKEGWSVDRLPRIRKTQQLLKEALGEYEGLPDEIKEMDKPWTFISSIEPEIPSDAIPVLLKVWKQQLNWFEPFTIRQAKWVGRLYKIIPEDLVLLATWSQLYAITERMCSISGIDLNSESFDAALAMAPWELLTALWTEAVKLTKDYEFSLSELVQLSKESRVDLQEELDGITKLWIDYFRKGPKWLQLNAEQQKWIRGRLRLWVLEHPWTEDPSWLSWFEYEEGLTIEQFNSHRLSNTPKVVLEKFASNPLFKPIELLEVVGYEV